MGMPIRQARDEVAYGMIYMRWYIDHAVEYLSPEITRETSTELHTVYYEPRWVIAAIAPWNYPFSMCIWTCIQALLAGNSVIFKTSKECILTGRLIAEIISRSDLPEWVWTEIYGSGELGERLMSEDIDFITFTGSTNVGQGLAKHAFEKSIGCVMELGGSAPGIICEDADIDRVIETIYFLRYSNSGQMCDGLKRLIVHISRYDEVVEKLSQILLSKKIWDATLETTDIWPVVSENQRVDIERQYSDALEKWATILARLDIPVWLEWAYFAPALLGNITPDMAVWREEVFGPILPIVTFSTIEETIELANDTEYGLGAYVFTESRELFEQIAREIESGMVQMNTLNYCIPESPFGGYKKSWIGREHGKWGFHEFCNIKVTSIPKK
jgi:succinate-semialdehyde dehydrogenase / glutarate-semialdehyde dehydrogenase